MLEDETYRAIRSLTAPSPPVADGCAHGERLLLKDKEKKKNAIGADLGSE